MITDSTPAATPAATGKTCKKGGRPRVTLRPGFETRYREVLERLQKHSISRRKAARELEVGYATLKRLLDAGWQG